MKISPKQGILLIKKHKKSQIKADIVLEEIDDDKRLITGEILASENALYPVGLTIIFGKYSLYPLTLQGQDYFFLDENDVIGICDYKE